MSRDSLDSSAQHPYDKSSTGYEYQGLDHMVGEYDRVTKGEYLRSWNLGHTTTR